MKSALSETTITGIETNIQLHIELLGDDEFVAGGSDIHYLEQRLKAIRQ